jgi:hypothetical protein
MCRDQCGVAVYPSLSTCARSVCSLLARVSFSRIISLISTTSSRLAISYSLSKCATSVVQVGGILSRRGMSARSDLDLMASFALSRPVSSGDLPQSDGPYRYAVPPIALRFAPCLEGEQGSRNGAGVDRAGGQAFVNDRRVAQFDPPPATQRVALPPAMMTTCGLL